MPTVLLVEDSLTETELLTRYLSQVGVIVMSAKTCEEARTMLKSQKPDLVLLDVLLPGQSGFELCRELKIQDSTSRIPVVICSTKGTDIDKLWGAMLGADAYLPKPVNQGDLAETVLRLTTSLGKL